MLGRSATLFILLMLYGANTYGLTLESDGKKKNLVELYTSESCSSCPPAEKWLNSLKSAGTLWKDYIPVEFHVDYWNHLHWKDRYSRPEFSSRQREYHRKIQGGVYTPQVIKNGVNQRGWFRQRLTTTPEQVKEMSHLKSHISLDKGKVQVNYIPAPKKMLEGNHKCQFAIMSGEIITKVENGENEGRTLPHEFVVRQFVEGDLKKFGTSYKCDLNFSSEQLKELKSSSVAIWVSNDSTGEVLQAIGNWIKK